ncbi:formate dehydrogenase accessory sulfurtransferase FdhD [Paenalcaligenes faecalis]|uniref:formate dehydrogenase accessory sulfurtransferase FdhD n=1 Tax=Paenalcaligenes faecalis TaxID=2980099 RepID=UPI0022B971CD|nr:formate dehydrogenase accessory sulfurtransferase FdhD [Paenalcaligenes faecalis]
MSIPFTAANTDLLPAQTDQLVWRKPRESDLHEQADVLATEIPVALQYNGISHAVLLATPTFLEDLAVGFSFTEGIIRSASDIYDIRIEHDERGYSLDIEIASACLNQLKQRRRQLAGRTGCGLCGLESLNEVRRDLPAVNPPLVHYQPQAIFSALDQLRDQQPLHQITGATHGAGWATHDGVIQVVREDVGRHNALDKLIGHLLQQKTPAHTGMLVVSSRASFEMVQKTATLGVPILVAVSAPTSYAVQVANELGLLLVAFGRSKQFSLYSHPEFLATHS